MRSVAAVHQAVKLNAVFTQGQAAEPELKRLFEPGNSELASSVRAELRMTSARLPCRSRDPQSARFVPSTQSLKRITFAPQISDLRHRQKMTRNKWDMLLHCGTQSTKAGFTGRSWQVRE